MGNLRDKYTNEEWDELEIKSKKFFEKQKQQKPLIQQIETIVKQTPNDQELGSRIRELIKFGNIIEI